MPQMFSVTAATAPRSASLRVFLPINDQQTVPLEGTQTCLQGSKHRHRDIGGVTFLNVLAMTSRWWTIRFVHSAMNRSAWAKCSRS